MPALKKIHDRFGAKEFALLGISLDESRDALDKKIEEKGLTYLIGWDPAVDAQGKPVLDEKEQRKGMGWASVSSETYNVPAHGIPSIWLIDRDGKIARRELRGEELEAAIAELVEGKGRNAAPASGGKSGG